MMKKSRFFIALLVMFVAASGYAQGSVSETLKENICFREALKEYYVTSGSIKSTAKDLAHAFKQTAPFLFESGDMDLLVIGTLEKLTDRYAEEGLVDCMTDVTLPEVKELGVTEKDLKEATSMLTTPEGRTFIEHSLQLAESLKDEITSTLEKNRTKIKNGETLDPIQPKAGIDVEYMKKFDQTMNSQLVNTTEMVIDRNTSYIKSMGEKMGLETSKVKKMEEEMEKLQTWSNENMPTMVLNHAYGIITMEDLDFANKFYSSVTLNKMTNVVSMVDPASLGIGMMTHYLQWMQDHGAVLKDGAMDIVNAAKQMLGN